MIKKGIEKFEDNAIQLLLESVKDYTIIFINTDGTVQFWNDSAEKIFGYKASEIKGESFLLFYPKEAIDKAKPSYELDQALQKGKVEVDGWRIRKDGSRFWSHDVITALYEENELIGYSIIVRDLSEIKNVENALTRSDNKYKNLIQGVNDYAIFMLDEMGNISTWNQGAKYITGFSEHEALGKDFSIFFNDNKQHGINANHYLIQAKRSGRMELEDLMNRKDGSSFFSNTTITTIYDDSKKVIGFSVIMKDLTEKKEAEEELRLKEERYRLLIEGVRDYAIFMLDPNGYIATWNEGAKRIKGYSEREIIGRHFSVFYPQEKQDQRFPDYELEQAKKFGRFEDEGIRVRKDGSTFYANVVITAIYNKRKELIGFTKVTRDLTERKNTEEALRVSEERYRLLIEGVKDYAIFMLDPQGNISTWNEGARRLKGYSQGEIVGRHFSIFYTQPDKDRKYPEYELEQAIKFGRYEDEGLRVRKDGTTFYANVIITAIFNNQKQLVGFSKITRDLTERVENERRLHKLNSELETKVSNRTRELQKSLEDLKRINSDLDSFIYTASHDLKAPVSNIEGLIYTLHDVLQENEIDKDEVDSIIELMKQSVLKFQGTIKDLTEVNISQKNIDEDKVALNLEEIVEDVKLSIINLVTNSNTQIELNTYQCPVIHFSKKHIKSIVYNLISNAIKYRSLDRDPVIKISSYCESKFTVIKVEDNGLGIKEQDKEKIFQMFKRLHDHVEGTGIGLYIVKRIIENAGGKIEVESQVDKGTTFKIYIPVQ
jgi:PAS domain S-box-containing protein